VLSGRNNGLVPRRAAGGRCADSSVPEPQDCGAGILASEPDRMSGENERTGPRRRGAAVNR